MKKHLRMATLAFAATSVLLVGCGDGEDDTTVDEDTTVVEDEGAVDDGAVEEEPVDDGAMEEDVEDEG